MHRCSCDINSPLLQWGISPTCSTTDLLLVGFGWRTLIASYTRLSLGLEKKNVRTFIYNKNITQSVLNIVGKHSSLLSSLPLWDDHMMNKAHERITGWYLESHRRTNTVWFHLRKISKAFKIMETEDRMVAARGWGKGEMGSHLIGIGLKFCKTEKF